MCMRHTPALIKYAYLPLIRYWFLECNLPPLQSKSSSRPAPPSQPAIFSAHLLSELLTGLQQIDCQRCSQGPSIRLSLSLSVARPSGNEAFCSLFAAAPPPSSPAPSPSLLFVPSKKQPLPSFVPSLCFSRSPVFQEQCFHLFSSSCDFLSFFSLTLCLLSLLFVSTN